MSLLTFVERARSTTSSRLPAYVHDVEQLSIAVTTNQTIDIGGTLAKVAFTSKSKDGGGEVILDFAKFDSSDVDAWLHFVKGKLQPISELKLTGGGAVKYADIIRERLGEKVKVIHVDEMKSLANGINFLGTLPDEIFTFNTTTNTIENLPQMTLDASRSGECLFPGLIANIGSGVSFVACTTPTDFKRVGGTPLGGGSYAGLCHLVADCKIFEETVKANEEITNSPRTPETNHIDLLVGNGAVGLPSAAIASSFGKAGLNLTDKPKETKQASKNGILELESGLTKSVETVDSIALMTCWNIGQQGALWAQHVGAKHVLFVRNQTNIMKYLSMSVGRVGGTKPLFMVHAGFLGVLGAFFT